MSSIRSNPADKDIMNMALTLARRGLGEVAPNPAVGCVIVSPHRKGKIVGRGWTQSGGRPHAEVEAIKQAGNLTIGAKAYISLEPCSHFGKTPPCTLALINAGIKKVFIAIKDPDKRVSGNGIKDLKAAGVEVEYGLLKHEAHQINLGFFSKVNLERPLITWKIASSSDGKIGTFTGQSKWITNKLSRNFGHLLRAENDAILTSSKTISIDDPRLNCRLPGMNIRSPQPIVLDSKLALLPEHKIMKGKKKPWIYTGPNISKNKKRNLKKLGAQIFEMDLNSNNLLDLSTIVTHLSKLGVTRLLVECGGQLASSFIKYDLIDQIFWMRSPNIIGGDGLPVVSSLKLDNIKRTKQFLHKETHVLGSDVLTILEKGS